MTTHDLSTYIKSGPDGCLSASSPKIHSKLYRSTNDEIFSIMRYDKDTLGKEEFDTIGLFRSVIAKKGKLVSFSPPKSQPFQEMSSTAIGEEITIQQMVEGTMINVFWNPALTAEGEYVVENATDLNEKGIKGEWEVATRSTVGGRVSYFQEDDSPTFRRMFLEASNECGLDIDALPVSNKDSLFSYSFVLSHPKNRLVSLATKPSLHLVAIYKINGMIVTPLTGIDMKNSSVILNTKVKYPEEYDNIDVTWDSVTKSCKDMTMEFDKPGLVFHNTTTGHRSKFRNAHYEQVKAIRGNEPKLQYHYLQLRKDGKVKEFLRYFPDKAPDLARYRAAVHAFTNALYENYKSCYIKKSGKLTTFPKRFQPHMFSLHKLYLEELREKKKFVGLPVVVGYVNTLPASHLMYSLNYTIRERYVKKKNMGLGVAPVPSPGSSESATSSDDGL